MPEDTGGAGPDGDTLLTLPGRTGWTDEGTAGDRPEPTGGSGVAPPRRARRPFLPAVGVVRAALVAVDFPDAPAASAPEPWQHPQAYRDWLVPAADRWFRTASFGRLGLEVRCLQRWFRMSRPADDYAFRRGIDFETHARYIEEAASLASADGDAAAGEADALFVVPPRGASGIPFSPAYIDRGGRQGDRPARLAFAGRPMRHAVTFGQDMWRWGPLVCNHETLHLLGLPDLYDFDPGPARAGAHRHVGGWDVMGHIAGHAPDLFAWHKFKLGWCDPGQAAALPPGGPGAAAEYRLSPVGRPGGLKMVVARLGETSALVVESRRREGLDAAAESEGVLVYRVDSAVRTGHGPIRVLCPSAGDGAPERGQLDGACLGLGPGRAAAVDVPAAGIAVEVRVQDAAGDVVRLTRRAHGVAGTGGPGTGPPHPEAGGST